MPLPLNVLILEDRPADAEILLHELRRTGYDPDWRRIETETDYITCLDPNLDIILADYNLPQFDALHALYLLQKSKLDIPFIVVTGSIEEVAIECMKQGASDYLLKDRLGRLGQAVERALQQKRLRKEKRQAEQEIQESQQFLESVLESIQDGISVLNPDLTIRLVNNVMKRWYAPNLPLEGKKCFVCYQNRYQACDPCPTLRCLKSGNVEKDIVPGLPGSPVEWLEVFSYPMKDTKSGEIIAVVEFVRDITSSRRAGQLQGAVYRISEAAHSAQNLGELYRQIHTIIGELMPANNFYIALYDEAIDMISVPYHVDEFDAPPAPHKPSNSLTTYVLRTGIPLLATRQVCDQLEQAGEVERIGTPSVDWLGVPLKTKGETIGVMAVQTYTEDARLKEDDKSVLVFVSTQVAMAIERKRAEETISQNAERLETLDVISQALAETSLNYQAILGIVTRYIAELFGDICVIALLSDNGTTLDPVAYYHPDPEVMTLLRSIMEQSPFGEGIIVPLQEGQPIFYPTITTEQMRQMLMPACWPNLDRIGISGFIVAPLQTQDRVIGALVLARNLGGRPYTIDDHAFIQAVADRAALSIINSRLYAENLTRLEHVQALREIDMAITGSVDLHVTLNIILEKAMEQLHVSAANVLLFNPHSQTLHFIAGRGFRTPTIQSTHLRLGQHYAGRAALERQTIHIPNLLEAQEWQERLSLLANEGFVSYYVVPLLSKGQIKGVMEVFHRSPLVCDQEWQDFLEALAGQAAIAIDNVNLFDDLQRSNVELKLAYDDTIEGWSRALDLRDRETEGHTQRVTETTELLARAMGLSDLDLVHARRGALLHDIGKMGVPDNVLLKAGELSEEEWVTMRKHPQYAYDMLSPIAYLRPALDIPYCHHEKWNGTGYPRGLKGEQIPLTARIFAVVDVWDAMTSERHYHPARPKDEVLEYIRSLADTHFDSKVVEIFLRLLWEGIIPG
jgi:putative nucleotidyltransferase with HDIG domain